MKSLQNKYRKLESELNDIMVSRVDEISALILAHISKTHLVMLGDPGTGKSYLIRKFAEAFPSDSEKVAFFEAALNSFTKPEEVFGPVDIQRWKTKSELTYKTEKFLPNARIAFLDELSRGEAVLNSLLTIVNERVFNVNGVATPVPLEMAVSATNFKFSSNEFEAMRDRFLQWLTPKKIDMNDEDAMYDFWTASEKSVSVRISEKELETVRAESESVKFDLETLKAFRGILCELSEVGIIVSDRRTKSIMKLVKASAWLNERDAMITEDLECVWTALWSDESQIPTVKKIVRKYVNPERQVIDEIFEKSQILMQSWKASPVKNPNNEVSNQLRAMRQKLANIKKPKAVNVQQYDLTMAILEKFQETVASVIVQTAGM